MDFYSIYEQYKHLMYTVAKDILNDPDYAQDAVQIAMTKIAKHIDMINKKKPEQRRDLIITVIRHAAIDMQRSRDRHWNHEIFWDDVSDIPETYIHSVYESSILPAIQKIPFKYREVLILRYASDLEDDEIASILGISRVNVRKRLSRGKQQLEKLLKKEGVL